MTAPVQPAVVTSLIRTWSPMLAGYLLSLPLARPLLDLLGVDTDTARRAVTGAVVTLLGAGYYVAVRLVERRWPAAGHLLGRAATLVYAAPASESAPEGSWQGRPPLPGAQATGNVRTLGEDEPSS